MRSLLSGGKAILSAGESSPTALRTPLHHVRAKLSANVEIAVGNPRACDAVHGRQGVHRGAHALTDRQRTRGARDPEDAGLKIISQYAPLVCAARRGRSPFRGQMEPLLTKALLQGVRRTR